MEGFGYDHDGSILLLHMCFVVGVGLIFDVFFGVSCGCVVSVGCVSCVVCRVCVCRVCRVGVSCEWAVCRVCVLYVV